MLRLAFAAGCALVLAARIASAEGAPSARFVSIDITPNQLVSGGQVRVAIETTPDVVGVDAEVGSRVIPIPQVDNGKYFGIGDLPRLPRFIRGRFSVRFVARTASGDAVEVSRIVQFN